jgi:hypothetical protein
MSDKGLSPLNRNLKVNTKSQALSTAQSLGSPVLAETISALLATAPTALTDNAIRDVAIEVRENITATGVMFFSRVAGSFTGEQTNGLALHTQSSGTMVRIRETANDENIWKNTANTWVQVPFTSPAVLTPGVYYVSLIYNCVGAASTTPQINMTSFTSTQALGNLPLPANSNFISGQTTGQNSFPSSRATSSVTSVGGIPYLALY